MFRKRVVISFLGWMRLNNIERLLGDDETKGFQGKNLSLDWGEENVCILLWQFLAGSVSHAAFWQSCPACRSLPGAAALSGIFTSISWAKSPGHHYRRWDVSCLRYSKVYIAFQLLPSIFNYYSLQLDDKSVQNHQVTPGMMSDLLDTQSQTKSFTL